MIVHDVDQNSLEWFLLRLSIPTASEFDKIITLKQWKYSSQAEGYMARLIEEWWTGEPTEAEQYQAPWMQTGQEREDSAVTSYEGIHLEGYTSRGGFITTDDGLIGCSPDRLIGSAGILEVKCPLLQNQLRTLITKNWTMDHMIQVQGQLWVTEREWVDLYSYHPRLRIDPVRVYRDEKFIAAIAANLKIFVQDMLQRREQIIASGHPPPPRPMPEVLPPVADGLSEEDVEEHITNLRRQGVLNG